MHDPHDLNRTADFPQHSADALSAGLAAAFGASRSSLGDLRPTFGSRASKMAISVAPR